MNGNYKFIRTTDGIYEGADFSGNSIHRSLNIYEKEHCGGNLRKFIIRELLECDSWEEPKVLFESEELSEKEADNMFDEFVEGNNEFIYTTYAVA